MTQDKKTVSVVMCTYNGGKYIKEQLDSIVQQTYQPCEIIIQDDGSTDDTMDIVRQYAKQCPIIRITQNELGKGINNNFFSAIRKAQGEYVAISDQDDIWKLDKIEVMLQAIGDKMMCVGRSVPFYDEGDKRVNVHYDERKPNCNIVRMMYASMPGHCTLFRRELLEHLPSHLETRPIYTHTWYDVILGQTAAALDSIVLLDRVITMQRRHVNAASYKDVDTKRLRGMGNGAYIVWWGIKNYHRVKPLMAKHFSVRGGFLESIQSDAPIYKDAVRLMRCESKQGLWAFLGLVRWYVKYRHVMFYTYENDPVALVRAVLNPFMQVYNYRYLLNKK